jgi:hypothetical protein
MEGVIASARIANMAYEGSVSRRVASVAQL